jgi:thiosulfate dehydrogenase [quinone] large subunit
MMTIQPENDWRSDRSIAYAIMRLTFGINLFMRGVMRIYLGTGMFAQGMVKQFEGTPMPRSIITPFALMLPWAETAIGLLIILGLQTRVALIAGSLMMTALTFGTMVRQDFQTAWLQLGYVLMFFLLLTLRSWNLISLDARPQRSQRHGDRT